MSDPVTYTDGFDPDAYPSLDVTDHRTVLVESTDDQPFIVVNRAAPTPLPGLLGAELIPVRPPITLSFYWADDGQTLMTLVDDGAPQPVAWYLNTGRLHSIDGRDLTDVYCKLAVVGAVQEWRRVRATP